MPPRARRVLVLIEKPGPAQARELEERHGSGNLLMLEGRARLTASFIEFARARQQAAHSPGTEPKLALAIGAYARDHPVLAVLTDSEIIDLGMPTSLDTKPRHEAVDDQPGAPAARLSGRLAHDPAARPARACRTLIGPGRRIRGRSGC
jgi:hypothetical protein